MAAPILANTIGVIRDAREVSISPLDRGFLYGDAVYEVWRTRQGHLFAFEEHWDRLHRSADALAIKVPFTEAGLRAELRNTIREHGVRWPEFRGDYYVRLQLSRGGGSIGLDPGLADNPFWVILVQPLAAPPNPAVGLSLSIARTLKRNPIWSLNPAWKTGNYLNNLLCLREARERGADEVLMLNEREELTEAAVCNIVFWTGRTLVAPSLACGILDGITRRLLLHAFAGLVGWKVDERPVREKELPGFEGCFLTSTTKDLAPVRSIDQVRFSITTASEGEKLRRGFQAWADERAARDPANRMVER
ncbi:MAG: aminotransferase class IV [Puniceicoccaceae bacterium]|nr:MAG: aminotransferase class IV [Puniceicoccaceae bacterium]